MALDEKLVEQIRQENNHKELITSFGKLTAAITSKDDKLLVKALTDQPAIFKQSMEQVIKSLPKPETPQVEVNINYENLVSSFKQISEETALRVEKAINKVIEALENRLLPDTFELVKGYGGETQSVKVKYKSAKEINSKK